MYNENRSVFAKQKTVVKMLTKSHVANYVDLSTGSWGGASVKKTEKINLCPD